MKLIYRLVIELFAIALSLFIVGEISIMLGCTHLNKEGRITSGIFPFYFFWGIGSASALIRLHHAEKLSAKPILGLFAAAGSPLLALLIMLLAYIAVAGLEVISTSAFMLNGRIIAFVTICTIFVLLMIRFISFYENLSVVTSFRFCFLSLLTIVCAGILSVIVPLDRTEVFSRLIHIVLGFGTFVALYKIYGVSR